MGSREFVLEGDEAHHLSRVCRAEVGDQATLFNGRGLRAAAKIVNISKRDVQLTINSEISSAPDQGLPVIGCPLPKGDRASMVIEKCTELGVAQFIPLFSKRSVVHPRDAKLDKLRRTMIEACKQSHRPYLMEIAELTSFEEFIRRDLRGIKVLLNPTGDVNLSQVTASVDAFAVGPEGGWDESELAIAKANDWQIASISGNILRMETAILAAASWARIRSSS